MSDPIDTAGHLPYPSCEATPMLNVSTAYAPRSQFARRVPPAIRLGSEVNPLNPKPFKIGAVSAKPMSGNRWMLRYHDPETKRDVRRRLSGLTLKEVQSIATTISHEILARGGFIPGAKAALPSIAEGIAEAIALRNTIAAVRRDRAGRAAQFVKWLAETHPGIRRWDQLRPAMILGYVYDLERRGLAYDTVRLALAPIKLAWQHMAENFPGVIRPLPRIKLKPPLRKQIECLDAPEVAALLDWLRHHQPDLWPMATLQALCGLRVLEAAALRVQDIDLAARTLTVTDTGHHRPKTRDSYRTLPLPDEAVDAIAQAMAAQKVRPATGELFTNTQGNLWSKNALVLRWRRALRTAAVDLKNPRLPTIPPRKLRASFATTASRLGAPDRLLKAFMGHTSGDVLGGHYLRIDLSELRTVSDRMERWRKAPADSKEAGNILATLAREQS